MTDQILRAKGRARRTHSYFHTKAATTEFANQSQARPRLLQLEVFLQTATCLRPACRAVQSTKEGYSNEPPRTSSVLPNSISIYLELIRQQDIVVHLQLVSLPKPKDPPLFPAQHPGFLKPLSLSQLPLGQRPLSACVAIS